MAENQVFLSYALEDTDTARHVARAIESRGFALSWERYRDPDAVQSLALHEALSAADCVVVLWSCHSVRAQQVLDEASLGRVRGNLVQGTLDDADLPMPFLLDEPERLTDQWSVTTLVGQIARVLEGGAAAPKGPADVRGSIPQAGLLEQAETYADAGELSEAIGLYEKWSSRRSRRTRRRERGTTGTFSNFLNVLPGRDVFYLFWSARAAESKHVERQWRYALRLRGIDFIDPVPLDPPEVAPPPELALLHGGDWQGAYRSAARPSAIPSPETDLG